MKTLINFLAFFLVSHLAWSQEKKPAPKYYTWVELMNKDKSGIGYLLDMDNKGITHLRKQDLEKWLAGEDQLSHYITAVSIEKLKFRRKNSSLRGILYGGLIGGTALGLWAVVTNAGCSGKGLCFEFSDPAAFGIGFVVGVLPGAIIGSMIGTKRISIPINGSRGYFLNQESRIRNYMIDY